jgi:molybdopterin-guanine dinucleotide biosynthesis protein A
MSRVLGALIAGGKSLRMGREKCFVTLRGQSLLGYTLQRLTPQVDAVVINANGDAKRFAAFGLPVVPDVLAQVTMPLAGLHAVLCHGVAQGFSHALVVPSDTPFLPPDLRRRLEDASPAIARSAAQDHYLTGFWPTALAATLGHALEDGQLARMKDWITLAEARAVEWPVQPFDPFFNINTEADLAAAERIMEQLR